MEKEFKLGCSPITNIIYAGNVKNGMWIGEKKDVTNTAVMAVAEHLLKANQCVKFVDSKGDSYILSVKKTENK